MYYVVTCRDVDNSAAGRGEHLSSHRQYVDENAQLIVLSGPLMAVDGQTRRGQLFVLDVPSPADAQAFVSGDPFTQAGVFSSVVVETLLPRFEQGTRVTTPEGDGRWPGASS